MLSLRPAARRLPPLLLALALLSGLAGCGDERPWHATEISGSLPALAFEMTRAGDGRAVEAEDYRGKVVLLYFGYTFCPDICPLTLANAAQVLDRLGERAEGVRVLFVTVDPARDTAAVLKDYAAAFGPQVEALRGDADRLAALARRYRVAYSVETSGAGETEVTHSPAVYVFDAEGDARLLVSSLDTAQPDLEGTAADLERLLDEEQGGGPFAWLARLL